MRSHAMQLVHQSRQEHLYDSFRAIHAQQSRQVVLGTKSTDSRAGFDTTRGTRIMPATTRIAGEDGAEHIMQAGPTNAYIGAKATAYDPPYRLPGSNF